MYLLKIVIVFLIIFIISTKVKNWIAIAIFIGAIFCGFLFSLDFINIFKTLFQGMFSVQSILLAILVFLITILGNIMKELNILSLCSKASKIIFKSDKFAGVFMASIIGLLPMPGGALFSAPLVKESLKDKINSGKLTAINYWFRHIWEFWWPLYPAVILLFAISEVDPLKWSMTAFFFTPVSVFLGWFYLLRKIKNGKVNKDNEDKLNKEILKPFLPIVSVIIFAIFYKIILFYFKIKLYSQLVIIPAVLIGILFVFSLWKNKKVSFFKIMNFKRTVPIVLLILVIMGYSRIIEEAQVAYKIASDIQNLHLHPLLVFALLPFIAGIITGIAVGFIGASFPVIIKMVSNYSQFNLFSVLIFAFGCGFVGMMLSPFHACFLFSKDFFDASWRKSYKYLLLPAFSLLLFFIIFYFVLNYFGL